MLEKIKTLFYLLKISFSKPNLFFKLLSIKNIKTLIRALQNESKSELLSNYKSALVRVNSFEKKVFFNNLDGFKYNIDNIYFFKRGYLYFRGWVISNDGNVKVSISIDGSVFYNEIQRIERKDLIGLCNSEYAKTSGFIAIIKTKHPTNIIINYASDKNSSTFPIQVDKTLNLSLISLNDQYDIFKKINADITNESKNYFKRDYLSKIRLKPLISIVVPVYNVDPIWLKKCVNSVRSQLYSNWELCLYDDCSSNEATLKYLQDLKSLNDERIKVDFGTKNLHISLATNAAVRRSKGSFIAFMDHDDELDEFALIEVAKAINLNPQVKLIYSDEDKINTEGYTYGPYFKSSFNKDLLLSNNYISHLSVVSRNIGDSIGWLRAGYEGSQDHDFLLRILDNLNLSEIIHIPKVLYHWRAIEGSTSMNYDEKGYAFDSGKRALEDYMQRNLIEGEVLKGNWGGAYRFKRKLVKKLKVSIIIPFKDEVDLLIRLIASIELKTKYEDYEILLINNNSKNISTFNYLKNIESEIIRVFEYNVPFNYSKINNWAVNKAKGEYVLLLNNDIEIINEGWLSNMVEHIQRDDVGIVGCKLLYDDGTLQHAGVITGIGGSAGHICKGMSNKAHYFNMNVIKNVSAVTGACLLTKKSIYKEVGGLDENLFQIAYNDIDFCLKVREKGFLITYTPYSELYHFESKSRGYEDSKEKIERHNKERNNLTEKWGSFLMNDFYFNVNFSLEYQNFYLKLK